MFNSYKRALAGIGFILCLFSSVFAYSGGSGTSTDPYLIATPADLNSLGATSGDWSKCFKLIADINMACYTDTQYKIIGSDRGSPFTGIFDGNGHKIYKLNYTDTSYTYHIGIFGYATTATIKNLGIEDVNFAKSSSYFYYVGTLAGYVSNCTIQDCYSTGKLTISAESDKGAGGLIGGQNYGTVTNCRSSVTIINTESVPTGGLIGYQNYGTIKNCYSTGQITYHTVSYSSYSGGLVGYQYAGNIVNCYSTSNVTTPYSTTSSYTGGLVGYSSFNAYITNSYATGNVTGSYYTGGLIGYGYHAEDSYATGTVSNAYKIGGFAGYIGDCYGVVNCFWDTESSGCSDGVPGSTLTGLTGKTTAEMKSLATFTDADWSIDDIYGDDTTTWVMVSEGQDYPKLQLLYWQDRFADLPSFSGNGTEADPYQINSAEDFNALGNYCGVWDKYIVLTTDIDLDGYVVMPIGNAFYKFTGNFDGQGFIISNATMNMPNKNYVGLFGRVCDDGVISNLGVEDVNITGKKLLGGLAGFNSGGTISNCYTTGYVKPNSSTFAGGLIGFSARATISDCDSDVNLIGSGLNIGGLVGCNGKRNTIFNCYASGAITDINSSKFGSSAGGLVGNNSGTIQQCYATGDITAILNSSAEYFHFGGLAGDNTRGLISSCYATGSISFTSNPSTALISTGGFLGTNVYSDVNDCYSTGQIAFDCGDETQYVVGGVVGWNLGNSINRCYSKCAIGSGSSAEADYGVGGVAGLDSNSVISGCFWDIQTSGKTTSGGGKGLTTEQMKTMLLYQNAGWMDNGWIMNDGVDYPHLVWENTEGVAIPAEQAPPLTGSGTEADPYQIWTAADFAYLSWYKSIIDKHFILMADIDLENVRIHPIGEFGLFTGTFDGNGYKIKNVSIYEPAGSFTGLFGRVGAGGEIKNLVVKNVSIVGGDYTGGLIGKNLGGTISNCGTTGTVDGFTCVGGLIGKSTGTVDQCYSKADATAWEDVNSCVGGLIGQSGNSITNSYAVGDVNCRYSSNSSAGGLVGRSIYLSSIIQRCYSTGYVSADGKNIKKGGFLGSVYGQPSIYFGNTVYYVTYSYWDTETSGMTTSAGSASYSTTRPYTLMPSTGAIGKTTEEMQTASTFSTWGIGEPGTQRMWTLYPDSYPCLTWQLDIPTPDVVSMTQADAENAIVAAGLTVTITTAYSGSVPNGCVISQDPVAGQAALEGSSVNIVVSIGSAYYGGTGTEANPYQIADVNGLLALASTPTEYDKSFILTADINMAGQVFTTAIIAADSDANSTFHGTAFTGTFDGNGNKINHFTINGASNSYIGLFGKVSGGTIKKVGLEDYSISSSAVSYYSGSLVGYNNNGIISSCYSTGSVTGYSCVGALTGCNNGGSLSNCYSIGIVNGSSSYVGGLTGYNYSSSVSNCYSTSAVTGSSYVGGMVGGNIYGNVINCYSTGSVIGSSNAGGLAGYSNGNVLGCFWDVNSSGQISSAGGTGKTTAEMQTLSTYTDAGWDFSYTDGDDADWFIQIDEYPILTWQISSADLYTDGRNNFRDFAVFAKYWMRDDCRIYNDYCEWSDLDFNGSVDIDDLIELMNYWLDEGVYD